MPHKARRVVRVLVVGQTPPPNHGQAIMIQAMLEAGCGDRVAMHHVRMAFSEDMRDVGRFHIRKLLQVLSVISRIVALRIRYRTSVLYYPPAPPRRVPMLRDMLILIPTRWLFRHTVFHFHAGGLTELYPSLPAPLRWAFRLAYGRPDAAIRTSALNPEDGEALQASREYVVPNGIADPAKGYAASAKSSTPEILFVGRICESKGAMVTLEACKLLLADGHDVHFSLMGAFESDEFKRSLMAYISANGLDAHVSLLGELTGPRKWEAYARSWLLCFPTFFEGESFGLVAVEAMSFGLPVVATRWRGLPSVVADEETGFLVPVRDPHAVASRIALLVDDGALRSALGTRGRARFEEHFSLARFSASMQRVFEDLLPGTIDD